MAGAAKAPMLDMGIVAAVGIGYVITIVLIGPACRSYLDKLWHALAVSCLLHTYTLVQVCDLRRSAQHRQQEPSRLVVEAAMQRQPSSMIEGAC